MARTRFHSLDGLRGVCALSVVMYHCELLFRPGVIFCHGYLAVDMFFLLSGFVVAASYDARLTAGLTTAQFLMLRLRRLAPVYWAGLAVCLAGALLTTLWIASPGPGQVTLWALMATVLVPHLGSQTFAYPTNPVAWTLLWEIIVNIVYACWLRRLGSKTLLGLIVLLLAAAIAESLVNPRGWSFGMTGADLWFGGLRTFPEFLMGVLLFRGFQAGGLDRLPKMTPLLPLTVWLAIAVIPEAPPLLDAVIVIFACPLLVAALLRNDGQSPAWFGLLGAISYPLYASHLALISLARLTPVFGLNLHADALRATLVVLLTIVLAWTIHLAVEPAGRAWLSRFLRVPRAAKAPPGACHPTPEPV